ncbi:reverse transcriptase domain-containing protein [Isosphaeraceae bacterium EP7]
MSGYGSIRAPLGPGDFYAMRRARRRARSGLADGGSPSLAQVGDHEFLIAIYDELRAKGGQAPGPDGVTYQDLGRRETAAVLRDLAATIRDGTYKPGPSRRVAIPKAGSSKTRTLTIRGVADRVISKALLEVLSPVFEPSLDDRSHGFRPGRNTWTLLATLEADMAARSRYVLAIDDVEAAFDNVSIPCLLEDLTDPIEDRRLHALVEAVIRGSTDLARVAGIDQGDPISPLLLNVRLDACHDRAFRGRPNEIPWLRYADNLIYTCEDEAEATDALDASRELLDRAGHNLKQQDGPPFDLRRGECRLLGFALRWQDDRLQLSPGRTAWTKLQTELESAHEDPDPPSMALAICRGWIGSLGPAFGPQHAAAMTGRILGIAAALGFREVAPRETTLGWCREAHGRWERTRHERGGGG